MKYHVVLKFMAILLCTVALVSAVGSAVAVSALSEYGLYSRTIDDFLMEHTEYDCDNAAAIIASRYASRVLGGCPEALLEEYFPESRYYRYTTNEGPWYYTLEDANENLLESTYDGQAGFQTRQFTIECEYITIVDYLNEDLVETTAPMDIQTDSTAAYAPTAEAPTVAYTPAAETIDWDEVLYCAEFEYYDPDVDGYRYVELAYLNSPRYLVTLYVTKDSFVPTPYMSILARLWDNRFNVIIGLAVSLLVFAACVVYLCCAAGRKPGGEEVRPAAVNRLPLDLYALCGCGLILLLVSIVESMTARIYSSHYITNVVDIGAITLAALCVLGCALIFVSFFYACTAQIKTKGGYWWRHCVITWAARTLWKGWNGAWCWLAGSYRWFCRKAPPFAKRSVKKGRAVFERLWTALVKGVRGCCRLLRKLVLACYGVLARFFGWIGQGVKRFFNLLPVTWQWLLTAFVMIFALYLAFYVYRYFTGFTLLVLCLCVGIVLYGANAFGTLLASAKRMSQGDLDTKVNKKALLGCFDEFAEDLNNLADVAVVAARNQMKSERMKTELITNMSHDIKTPLTSIINYVDLLQKAQSQEEAEQYLEVLARQSQRMKKLIEDLVEMSKATTGNLSVDIRQVDAGETVNQALGEFADKLAASQLTPVFNQPETPVYIQADGRLAWRVLSNLLSNAVKYALPGTRLYLDLVELEGKVLLSLKNISRDQLNVSAEELMERFVRGDASRNTEGSGLGLNIAKSLMELQNGQLQLLVDGDLFKATLIFPAAKAGE